MEDGLFIWHIQCARIYHGVHKSETKGKNLFSFYFSSICIIENSSLFEQKFHIIVYILVIDIRNIFKRTPTTKPKSYNLL